jgi:uroporphyrinogen decarboxylase
VKPKDRILRALHHEEADRVATGIDGWHGIQPNIGMDLRLLKERYGARLCFFGGLNCETLIEGTPEGARAEAEYAIRHAAKGAAGW